MFKPFGFQLGTGTAGPNFAPVASNVVISGVFEVGETLTASYDYFDANGHPESGSIWQWYSSDDDETWTPISGANALTYEVTGDEFFLYIRFGVTPSDGSLFGAEVFSASGFVNWFAGAAGFLGDPLVTGQSVGGAIAEITNQANASPDLTQSTAASKPTLGRYPRGGINNRFTIPTEDLTNAGWGKAGNSSISGTIALGSVTLNNFVENSATSTHEVNRGGGITITAGQTINLSIHVKNRSSNRFLRLQATSDAGANGFRWLFNPTTGTTALAAGALGTGTVGTPVIEAVSDGYRISLSGTVAAAATAVAITFFLQDQGTVYTASYTGDGASGLYLGALQWSAGAALQDYQKVGAGPYDITETGVASVSKPRADGGDFMTFGQVAVGDNADGAFADTGNNWSILFDYCGFTTGTICAQTEEALDADRMFQLRVQSASALDLVLRGEVNSIAATATTGVPLRGSIVCTDGAVTINVNGTGRQAMVVGTAAKEAVNFTWYARNESVPAGFITGFSQPWALIGRALSVAEENQALADIQRSIGGP